MYFTAIENSSNDSLIDQALITILLCIMNDEFVVHLVKGPPDMFILLNKEVPYPLVMRCRYYVSGNRRSQFCGRLICICLQRFVVSLFEVRLHFLLCQLI